MTSNTSPPAKAGSTHNGEDGKCPHGHRLADNTCGPCSEGRPMRQAVENVTPQEWAALADYPESSITCRCGAEFRSHAKGKILAGGYRSITRKPCPKCGKHDDSVSVRGEQETYTL